ncbi:class I SAM-dependent methyltransferase [Clostridiaceae bacterium M8S5]|nr:class I SAM-dependent methyltransferase [Clostridiaceae bacterium M8S5]
MEIQNNDIYDFYNNIDEDKRLKRTKVNRIEFLTTTYFLDKILKPNSRILDACAGAGIYAYYLAEKGHKVTAGDLIQKNVDVMKSIQEKSNLFEKVYKGSILDLSQFEDCSFDMVLNLGSFYHLIDGNERKQSIKESLRVLKPNGIYAMSYINRYANIIKYREMFVEDFTLLNEYLEKGFHEKNKIFYASNPEEVEALLKQHGIQKIHNIATDGMKFIIRDTVNELSDTDFEKWMNLHYKTCEDKSILGTSEHGLLIGKKL